MRFGRSGYALSTVLPVVLGAALLAWNGSRFIGAQAKVRTKDLTFLPSPEIARALSLGHTNTVAKLRWIDSFAFFELQLERKDDQVAATGQSAFVRLYAMLTALDPKFLPYYQHASLNLGGVLGKHGPVLSLLNAGLLELPHETQLWRMLAAEYIIAFGGEEHLARSLDALLAAWYDAETTDEGRDAVWTWKKAMGRRVYQDLSQLAYWEEQLRVAQRGTPSETFIITTMREQVARFGEAQLGLLLAAGTKPPAAPPTKLSAVLQPDIIAAAWPKGLPPYGPVTIQEGTYVLRPDPFGYPYEILDGKPISPGWQLQRLAQRAGYASGQLAEKAKKLGYWPSSIAEVQLVGVTLEPLPAGCSWQLNGQQIELKTTPAPFPAWDPRQP